MKKPLLVMALIVLIAPNVFAGDYDLYMKSGQRSPKWDSMLKAGFDSFDGGNLEAGLIFLQKAYTAGCRDGLLLFKLGIYYESQKNYKEAEKYLKEASQILPLQYPNFAETKKMHEHLARLYYQSDQFDKALPEIEAALKDSSDDFMMLFMSAQVYRLQKNYSQAIANFEKALAVKAPADLKPNPTKTILSELMALYFEMKDYASCLKYADIILSAIPNDPTALSYKRQVQAIQYKQKEREAIKKIVE